MKKILFITISLFVVGVALSQNIEVKKFEHMVKDQTAELSPRKDINGTLCGLVKVRLKETGLLFLGNVVGDVETTGTEYYVYLAKGCKRINIKHPDYLPTTIVFTDYGITKIESGKTYLLELKAEKVMRKTTSKKSGVLVLNINPSDADLYVDEELIPRDNSGIYTLNIAQGNHYYTVQKGTFGINNRIVKVGSKPTKIEVNLTDYYASVNVTCALEKANIYIDSELKGIGMWKGLVPPGEITIEAKLKGYHPLLRTMMLNENDSIDILFSDFKMQSGSLSVNYKPDSCVVFIDGNKMGVTPLVIDNITIGDHRLKVEKPYYSEHIEYISIEEGQKLNISGSLPYKDAFSEIWIKAHEGDMHAQYKLAECYMYDHSYMKGWTRNMVNHKQAVYWFEKAALQGSRSAQCELSRCYSNGKGVAQDETKAFYWAKKAAEKGYAHGYYLLGWHYAYGQGVEKDMKKAISMLRQAIIIDDSTAAKELLRKLGYENEIPSIYDIQ